MKIIKLTILFLLLISIPAVSTAHDEGHGPKLTDTGMFGGIVTAVVNQGDASKGSEADLVYKAELVRSQDGTVRVYFYDKTMKPLKMAAFDKTADAVLITFSGDKENVEKFNLGLEGKAFKGNSPKAKSKPYNIDVVFTENGKKYLAAFDNLD